MKFRPILLHKCYHPDRETRPLECNCKIRISFDEAQELVEYGLAKRVPNSPNLIFYKRYEPESKYPFKKWNANIFNKVIAYLDGDASPAETQVYIDEYINVTQKLSKQWWRARLGP